MPKFVAAGFLHVLSTLTIVNYVQVGDCSKFVWIRYLLRLPLKDTRILHQTINHRITIISSQLVLQSSSALLSGAACSSGGRLQQGQDQTTSDRCCNSSVRTKDTANIRQMGKMCLDISSRRRATSRCEPCLTRAKRTTLQCSSLVGRISHGLTGFWGRNL